MNQTSLNRNVTIYRMVVAALLCAVGIVIPMVFPKIIIPPMTFTPASHVAIFLAMFISPATALFVALGTTLGFFLSGLPLIVVLRAASHLIFVLIGALMIRARPNLLSRLGSATAFCLLMGVIHAVCEVLVVTYFFFGDPAKYGDYFYTVLLLVGVGTVVHSSVDFLISALVWKALTKSNAVAGISSVKFEKLPDPAPKKQAS